MAPMNAIAIMKRLREEKKAKDKEEGQKSNGSVGQNKDPTSVSKPPPSASGFVARTKAVTADSSVAELQRHRCLSNNNNELWVNESLFERNVKIETTSGGYSGESENCTKSKRSNIININLLEDPIGHFAGGNGATLWDCSIALTNVLVERYANISSNNDNNDNNNNRRCGGGRSVMNVLELGSGLGLVGISMAASMGANVLVTDRLIAVPLLKRNVEHNKSVIIDGGGIVEVAELTWGKDQMKSLLTSERRKRSMSTSSGGGPATAPTPLFDIVIMSDLIFPSNSDNYSLLVDTLVVLLFDDNKDEQNNNNDEDDNTNTYTPTIIEIWLSVEPRRIDVEAKFWSMLNDKGIYAHRLETSNLPSSHPDDIHIYTLSTKEEKENVIIV
jgi:hypothetical protein